MYIDKKIRITQEGQKAVIDTIQIQVLPQRYMITSDYNGPDDTAAVTEALGDHLNYCSRMGLHNATPIGSLIPVRAFQKTVINTQSSILRWKVFPMKMSSSALRAVLTSLYMMTTAMKI